MSANRIVLAEYFTTDEVTLVFGVRTDWEEPEVVEIKRPLAEIRQYATDNFSLEADEEQEGLPASRSKVRHLDLEQWQEEFGPFVEPIREWAEPGDYLYLVPHDALHYLPLHTLKIDGQHLIERHPVLYTPSASVLKYCQAKRKQESILKKPGMASDTARALVLGDSHGDLVHARAEAIAVADAFGTRPFLLDDARKSLVSSTLAQQKEQIDVLHFACHAYFDPFQPLKSGLLMAPTENGLNEEEEAVIEKTPDGLPRKWFLTAEEFFGMEMSADLVTLSACDTGASQVRPGDELFGLMRSLIYAGTPSLVMSQWSVDQMSSGILMQEFYEALRAGQTKVEALQAAQLAVKALTAGEAIAYCEAAIELMRESGEEEAKATIAADIAELHFQAQNYGEAAALYQQLLAAPELAGDSRRYRELSVALSRSEFMRERAGDRQPDYQKEVYGHPFHWAPFILVGDWK